MRMSSSMTAGRVFGVGDRLVVDRNVIEELGGIDLLGSIRC